MYTVGDLEGGAKLKLVSRMKVLLAEKSIKERRTISLREVARDTGLAHTMVYGLANNTLREIPVNGVVTLCEYFGCDLCDMLQLVSDQEYEESIEALAVAA